MCKLIRHFLSGNCSTLVWTVREELALPFCIFTPILSGVWTGCCPRPPSFYWTCKQCAASVSLPGGLTSAAWWLKTRCMASAWKPLLKPHRCLWSLCSRLVSLPFHDTPYLLWGLCPWFFVFCCVCWFSDCTMLLFSSFLCSWPWNQKKIGL